MAEQVYFALDPKLAQSLVTFMETKPYAEVHQLITALINTPQIKLDLQKIQREALTQSAEPLPVPAVTKPLAVAARNGHKRKPAPVE